MDCITAPSESSPLSSGSGNAPVPVPFRTVRGLLKHQAVFTTPDSLRLPDLSGSRPYRIVCLPGIIGDVYQKRCGEHVRCHRYQVIEVNLHAVLILSMIIQPGIRTPKGYSMT